MFSVLSSGNTRCPNWCSRRIVVAGSMLTLIVALFTVHVVTYIDRYQIELTKVLKQIREISAIEGEFNNGRNDTPRKTKISKFRQNFLLWDLSADQPAIFDEPAQKGDEVFMYQCGLHRTCGGWADQLKGTMFAYVIANLTGRSFKARYLKPSCGTLNYIVPNRVNWYMNDSFELPGNQSHLEYHVGDSGLKSRVHRINFTETFGLKKKYEVFASNLEFLSGLANSTVYRNQVSWMRDLSPADVYGAIYKRLFKLSPSLQYRLEQILFKALPTEKHRLICIHIRLGHEAFDSDMEWRNSVKDLPKIWSWVGNKSKNDFDKIFVTADSPKVIESAYNQSFSHRIVTIPGSIIHSNKFSSQNMTYVCAGMEKLYLEHHILMNCDVLVRGHSGLSVIASAVRGTDEELYCLLDTGDIIPCARSNFSTFH